MKGWKDGGEREEEVGDRNRVRDRAVATDRHILFILL